MRGVRLLNSTSLYQVLKTYRMKLLLNYLSRVKLQLVSDSYESQVYRLKAHYRAVATIGAGGATAPQRI